MIRSGIDLLRRHVLLRGRGRGGDRRGRPARAVRADGARASRRPTRRSYEDSLALRARFHRSAGSGHPLIVPAPAPHAPYTCTAGDPARLRRARRRVRRAAAHPSRRDGARGRRVAARARHAGRAVGEEAAACSTRKVLAAHCVHVDEGEMRALKNANAGVAHNPTSNLKLGAGVAPVARMLELGVDVGIGTDGAASNNDLDMFEEMRLAALLAKGHERRPDGDAGARPRWRWRRASARAAMHMDHLTGSLEPGKRADLIVRRSRSPAQRARVRPRRRTASTAQIVYAVEVDRRRRRDVQRPLADARSRAADARRGRAARRGARAKRRASTPSSSSREVSVLQKLVAVGGAVEQESFEVQVKARIASAERVLAVIDERRGDRRPLEPLPPVRHLLVVRRSGSGLAALPRRRVPRRARARSPARARA